MSEMAINNMDGDADLFTCGTEDSTYSNRVNIGKSQDQQNPGKRVQDTGFHVTRLCRTY